MLHFFLLVYILWYICPPLVVTFLSCEFFLIIIFINGTSWHGFLGPGLPTASISILYACWFQVLFSYSLQIVEQSQPPFLSDFVVKCHVPSSEEFVIWRLYFALFWKLIFFLCKDSQRTIIIFYHREVMKLREKCLIGKCCPILRIWYSWVEKELMNIKTRKCDVSVWEFLSECACVTLGRSYACVFVFMHSIDVLT